MKNATITVIAALAILALCVQIYLALQINHRFNQLNNQNVQADRSQIKVPMLPKVPPPKSSSDDFIITHPLKNTYEKIQCMHNAIELDVVIQAYAANAKLESYS